MRTATYSPQSRQSRKLTSNFFGCFSLDLHRWHLGEFPLNVSMHSLEYHKTQNCEVQIRPFGLRSIRFADFGVWHTVFWSLGYSWVCEGYEFLQIEHQKCDDRAIIWEKKMWTLHFAAFVFFQHKSLPASPYSPHSNLGHSWHLFGFGFYFRLLANIF